MRKYILPVLILGVFCLMAQPPSTADYTLTFSSFSNGGAENPDPRTSSRFILSDIIGRGSSAADEVLSGSTYNLYGGFRNVDLDLREPFAWLEADGYEASSQIFHITWTAADTTIEDGEGWGIWKYDVQYSKKLDPGTWFDWQMGTELTFAEFGPDDPVEVKEDSVYYFRVRAYDLVGNVFDWSDPFAVGIDDSAMYQPPTVEYTVQQPTPGGDSDDSTWSPVTDGGLVDTLEIDETVEMRGDEYFVIDNNSSTDAIDIGLYSFNATPWELADSSGLDAFSLRALMNDDVTAPLSADYQPSQNIIPKGSDNVVFGAADTFGTGGYNLGTEGSGTDTEHLWLQLQAPKTVSRYGSYDDVRVNIRVEARNTMY
ncbi:MAG: hypothetical protein ACLFSQ_05340 [Candidatus Zixiibacteriota bacterium]